MKYLLFLPFFISFLCLKAQRFTVSDDQLIKIETSLYETEGQSYTNKDTLSLSFHNKLLYTITAPDSIFYTEAMRLFLDRNYYRDANEIVHLLAQPPIPIAIKKIDDSTYLFLGYRKFKSTLTIIHHAWLLKIEKNNLVIKKQLSTLNNNKELIAAFDDYTQTIQLLPFYALQINSTNGFWIENNTLKVCDSKNLSPQQYQGLIDNSVLYIYRLPNGNEITKRKNFLIFSRNCTEIKVHSR